MIERQKRLKEVYEYVRRNFPIHTQVDFAVSIHYSRVYISAAMNGKERYLTDKLFKNICDVFPIFSLEYLLHGTGSLLQEQEESVGDHFPTIVSEPKGENITPPIPQWADSLIQIISNQIKENEALHRELRHSIEKINHLEHDLHQLLQTLKK